jgi:hypothetical protein
MHLQQTKKESRESGGPQYYFHDLTDPVRIYLRQKGAVEVALVTPYGATKTNYIAVSTDRKLDRKLRPVRGKVGHDRIQQGRAAESIGEAIRLWYHLPPGDFDAITVDIDIIDNAFYLTPLKCRYVRRPKARDIPRIERSLTFTRGYVSELWTQQLAEINDEEPGMVSWALTEICRVVQAHFPTPTPHIQEADLLRASGPLKHLGVALGAYVGKGYDCFSEFTFLRFPTYSVPVEIKKFSHSFSYQERKYGKDLLSRAVVLCAVHDHRQVPKNIDVIELRAMCEYARRFSPRPRGQR